MRLDHIWTSRFRSLQVINACNWAQLAGLPWTPSCSIPCRWPARTTGPGSLFPSRTLTASRRSAVDCPGRCAAVTYLLAVGAVIVYSCCPDLVDFLDWCSQPIYLTDVLSVVFTSIELEGCQNYPPCSVLLLGPSRMRNIRCTSRSVLEVIYFSQSSLSS